jgi:hypothetical protein
LSVVSCQLSVVSCQFSVLSDQWSVVSGQRLENDSRFPMEICVFVSAGAKISIIPVEKSATLGGRQPGLILEAEEGRMCSGGATWKRLLI